MSAVGNRMTSVASLEISHSVHDWSKSKLFALRTLCITRPVRIVDHVFLSWEWKVGSAISRDRFAVSQIRLRLPLHTGLLRDGDKKVGGDRTNG
jgi:hypothetical protein